MKKKLLIQLLIISLIITICFLGYKFYLLKEDYSQLETSNSNYQRSLTEYKNKYTEEHKKNLKLEPQIRFMDKSVAICPADGTGLYHKYGCEKLDLFSYGCYIYNVQQAPSRGFSPCKLCQDFDNTQVETAEVVYVTNTGEKYHRSWCSYLKSKNPITKDKAISQGYSACSRCNP